MTEPTATPRPPAPQESPLLEFVEVMRQLRAQCPWKREQTHRSLSRYLVEELHETLEAIDTGDVAHLREELGDLLLQVYFHAVIAEENGEFTLDDVAADIVDKMRRRNPHVFGAETSMREGSPQDVDELWEAVKAEEKQRSSPLEGLPPGLPALLYADKVLGRLEREGRAVPTAPDGDLGDRLLALVAEARSAGVDPEQALRGAVRRVL